MSDIKLLQKKSLIKKNKNPSKKSKYSRVNHVHHHYTSGWFNSECLSPNNNNNNFVQNYDHNLISEALQKQQQHNQLFSSRSVVENGSKKFKRRRNCKSSASSTNQNNNNNNYDWSIEKLIPALGSGDNDQNLSKYNECITITTNNSNNKINRNIYHREPKIILEPHNTGRRNHDTNNDNKQMINLENFMINKNLIKTEQLKNDSIMTSTVFYNQLETVSFQYREPKNSKDLREHRQRTWIESPVTNLDSLISSSNRKLLHVHQTEELTSNNTNTGSSLVKNQDGFKITNENISKDNTQNNENDGDNKNNSKIEDKSPTTISHEDIIPCNIHQERNPTVERMSTKVLDRKTTVVLPSSSSSSPFTNENRAVTYCRYKATNAIENENDEEEEEEEEEEESCGSDDDEESDNTAIINPLNNIPFFDNKQFGDCEKNNEFFEIKKFNDTNKTFFKKSENSSELNTIVSCDKESKNNPSLINVSEDGDQNTPISSLKIYPEWIENPDGIDICPELKLDCLLMDKPRLNMANDNFERIRQQNTKLETLSKHQSSISLVTDTVIELESNEDVDDQCCSEEKEITNTNDAAADHLKIESLLRIDPVIQDNKKFGNLENDHTSSLYKNIEIDRNNAFQLELENLRKDSFKYGDKVHLLSNENEHCATAICETSYDSYSCSFQEESSSNNNNTNNIISNNIDDELIQGDTDDDESIEKLFVSPRLHDAPSSTTIILSTNYLSSTNILHSVDYEPLIDEEILDEESECLFIQAAITGTTINHHHDARMNNTDEQQQQTENPNLNNIHNETFNYEEINFETINHVSNNNTDDNIIINNNNNNNISIKLSATNLTPEQQEHETSFTLHNNSQISDEDNISQPQKNELHETRSQSQVKPINVNPSDKNNDSLYKYSTLTLDEESSRSFSNINQSPRSELGEDEKGIIQTKLYDNETAFLWESEINANESSSSSTSNDTYVVELKRQSTDLTSLFLGPDNEIETPLPISEKTSDIVHSSTEMFEKSSTLFHRKDKKKKRISTAKNAWDMQPGCINNSKNSKHKVISRQNNNFTSKRLKNSMLIQSRNTISSSLLLPNLQSNDGINKSKEVNNNNNNTNSFRRLQNSKIPITTKKYLENHCRKMGKEKKRGFGTRQSSSLVSANPMEKHNIFTNSNNNLTLKNTITTTNKTCKQIPEGSIKLSTPFDFFETIQEPPLKLISIKENCSANIKNQDYLTKFQCMTKIELDPFVVVRIPSFEIVNQSSNHSHYTTTSFKNSQPLIEINSYSNENDYSFDNNYSVPNLLPSSTLNTNQESLKIMKEAEIFLTEYRTPGSLSFVEKLPQFAAFYDLLREETSNGEHRSSLIVQTESNSTSKISKKSQKFLHSRSKHKEKMTVTFTRKRKFSLRKCISRRFRSIFRCCYTKRRKDSHCSKMYSPSAI